MLKTVESFCRQLSVSAVHGASIIAEWNSVIFIHQYMVDMQKINDTTDGKLNSTKCVCTVSFNYIFFKQFAYSVF